MFLPFVQHVYNLSINIIAETHEHPLTPFQPQFIHLQCMWK
ncbi:hypothetical protein SLEP1_g3048 [Rubroshorea leprosula]|uniref:Uncharacterized protein n=1 Tax=Rubroshorea leprosula TaxID=152421 RepID=A0AAV5HRG2_9ROSI|nr:hypothetical protein SLEP1_g3048 [Rubroshorea leprosula]